MNKKENANDILKQMYDEFKEQKQMLMEAIQKNDNKIAEIERYLESLFQKEDIDYKVFSPRNVESVYKEKIEEENSRKTKIENDNQNLYKKTAFYIDKMEKLEKVIPAIRGKVNTSHSPLMENNISMIALQENDRQRIARELHDTVVQNLVHIIHKVELATKYMEKDLVSSRLELCSINTVLKESIDELRNTIFDLRPMHIDDLGFIEALENLKDELQQKAKPSLLIKFDIKEIMETDDILLMSIYRIIQECCVNTIKHADAKNLVVKLSEDMSNIKITIKDDGKGFDLKKVRQEKQNSFGIKMTEERVHLLFGKIHINSRLNSGTLIEIEIPNRGKEE